LTHSILTITQARILKELNASPLRFNEINGKISICAPSLTVALKILFSKKLIWREPFHIGRYIISARGKKLIETVMDCELI